MKDKIERTVWDALEGSRKIRVTLKRESAEYVEYLLKIERSGIIKIEDNKKDNNKQDLTYIARARSWNHGNHRQVTLTLTDKFDVGWLTGYEMLHAIEKIEVVG